jgi:hypothetical protein
MWKLELADTIFPIYSSDILAPRAAARLARPIIWPCVWAMYILWEPVPTLSRLTSCPYNSKSNFSLLSKNDSMLIKSPICLSAPH